MTTEYRALLVGSEAHRLADMEAILLDLRMTTAATAKLKRESERDITDTQACQALLTMALVRYGRAHDKNGVRRAFRIPRAWVDQLPADLKEAHEHSIALRNKYIAHSVNDWEVNKPYAMVREDDGGRLTVHAVAVDNAWQLMTATDSLDRLWRLAKALGDRLEGEIEGQRACVLEAAKQIPQEELRRLMAKYQPAFPGQGKIDKTRSR